VVNFLASMRREPGLGADDRLLAVTTTSFDIAVLELFLPLSVGAGIVLADRETAMDGHALAELIPASRATVMQATPATWRMLLDSGKSLPSGFKALCGGEALAPDLARQLTRACGEVWNMYGPTETTVWSTCWRVDALDRNISIGTPIDNTTVHILDDDLKPCPVGMAGEICIGGAGVTLGYLDRPELTADRFVEMDLDASPDRVKGRGNAPGRLYRTGDLGRWRPDGLLEHLGRADHQIKLRGYRIELGEIEAVLLSHVDIARAVVMPREDRPGDVRLVAYVVPQPGANAGPAEWAEHLKRSLPAYMLPQHFVPLPALPLLPNGKIDRNALPSPLQTAATQAPEAISMRSMSTANGPEPASGVDTPIAVGYDASSEPPRIRYLMGVWTELLGTPAAATDNFFDLGGHSMLAVQMANRVARETGVRLKLMRLVNQNLTQIASELPELPASSASAPEPSAKGLAAGLGARISRGLKRLIGRGGTVVP
jgi:acyl-coenzyme A synthetase/AMP-(fatty) acid ligase